MRLGRTLAAVAFAAGAAAPIVSAATTQPASALCLSCLTQGGAVLAGGIHPGPDGFDYRTQIGAPGNPTLIHIYGHLSLLSLLPIKLSILPPIDFPTISIPAIGGGGGGGGG